MSRLRDIITGRRRKADRAQAQRIARAHDDYSTALRASLAAGPRCPAPADAAISRAGSVLTRARSNASPRALQWGSQSAAAFRQPRQTRSTR